MYYFYKKLKFYWNLIRIIYKQSIVMMSLTVPVMSQLVPRELYHAAALYLFWSLLHTGSSHYYSSYCANWSIWGLFSGGINALSPMCKVSLWLQQATSNNFNSWWLATTTWVMGKFGSFTHKNKSI